MNQFAQFFSRLTSRQRLTIGVVTTAAVAALILLVTMFSKPTYAMLFSNLNEQDASKIVQVLKEKSVPFQLDDNGKTILVPKQQLYELRLDLASAGLPNSSLIGYEIFDRTNLGVSDFVQKINYRRALEGELARTILNLDEVEGVRVHIVTPEKVLFKEDEKQTTASVVLKLKSGKPLRRESTQGIAHLVASSVEGLEAENVTILDTRGNVLTDNNKTSSLASLTSTQYEIQQKVENFLAQKAQRLLDGALGMGNSIIQVNADLDFRQVERNLEQYDPDNQVARSEQISEEKTVLRDSLPPSTRTNSVTNFEINKSLEHIVESVGNVKRLSIAAIVNNKPVTKEVKGEKSVEYTSRGTDEMNRLTDIVKKAVGFDSSRHDEFSVVNIPFGNETDTNLLMNTEETEQWDGLAVKVVLVLAMIIAVVIIRSLLNRMKFRIESPNVMWDTRISGELSASMPNYNNIKLPPAESEVPMEVVMKAKRREQIAEFVKTKPEDASRLLKVWLADETEI
jgi:flagellar M-ring protein FliF